MKWRKVDTFIQRCNKQISYIEIPTSNKLSGILKEEIEELRKELKLARTLATKYYKLYKKCK
jgi:hypothetical protein